MVTDTMRRLLSYLLILPVITFGQNKIDFNQGTLIQKNFCDTIPFEYIRNKMIVTVNINNQKKRFIFDTGATLCIADNIQGDMKNPALGTVFQYDASGTKKQVSVVNVSELTLGNLTFQHTPAVVINTKNTSFLTCFNYDGFIGSNMIRNCVTHIDVNKKLIILTDTIDKLRLQNTYQTALTLDNQSGPYIALSLDNSIKFNALFDSGSDEFITLTNQITQKAIRRDIAKVLNEGHGLSFIGLHGISNAESSHRTTFKNVKLGNAEITDFITAVSEKSYNAVGMQLADYGTITIDYPNKQFYLVANQQSQLYRHQKTVGFSLRPDQTTYSIGTVWTNTQADRLGLKTGYQLLKIDDLAISKRTAELDCILFMSRPFAKEKIRITYKDDIGQINVAELFEE